MPEIPGVLECRFVAVGDSRFAAFFRQDRLPDEGLGRPAGVSGGWRPSSRRPGS